MDNACPTWALYDSCMASTWILGLAMCASYYRDVLGKEGGAAIQISTMEGHFGLARHVAGSCSVCHSSYNAWGDVGVVDLLSARHDGATGGLRQFTFQLIRVQVLTRYMRVEGWCGSGVGGMCCGVIVGLYYVGCGPGLCMSIFMKWFILLLCLDRKCMCVCLLFTWYRHP